MEPEAYVHTDVFNMCVYNTSIDVHVFNVETYLYIILDMIYKCNSAS